MRVLIRDRNGSVTVEKEGADKHLVLLDVFADDAGGLAEKLAVLLAELGHSVQVVEVGGD